MERTDACFDTLQDSFFIVGNLGGVGGERPDNRLYINVAATVVPATSAKALEQGQEVSVSLGLTTQQAVQFVEDFFKEVTWKGGIYEKFLRRLLEKRWAVMTCAVAKDSAFEEWYAAMKYPKPRTVPAVVSR